MICCKISDAYTACIHYTMNIYNHKMKYYNSIWKHKITLLLCTRILVITVITQLWYK